MKNISAFLLVTISLVINISGINAHTVLTQSSANTTNVRVSREHGGSIQTRLGYNVAVNSESTLNREWIAVHDSTLPVDFVGTPGIKTVFEQDRVSGRYKYTTKYGIQAKEPIAAIQVRFLLFDIWGNHIKTLVQTEVADIKGVKELSGIWNAFTENEVSEYYASIAFIAKVRTQGSELTKPRVIEPNLAPVLEEARKFSKKFTFEDLEPKSEKK